MTSLRWCDITQHYVIILYRCFRKTYRSICLFVYLFLAQQPPVGQGLIIHKVSRSHTTHQSVGLLWMSEVHLLAGRNS